MAVTQQPPYAPGLGDPRQYRPGSFPGPTWQTTAAAPEEPIGPDEFAQQLNDLGALMVRFPLWFVWVRGRRWSATRYTGERIEGDSAEEIGARLGGTTAPPVAPPAAVRTVPPPVAQPVTRSAPPQSPVTAAGPPRVPRIVQQLGQHGSPHEAQPWQSQAGPPHPPAAPQWQAQPTPQASGAA